MYSGHMSQDGGRAGGLLVTRGTRQRRWYMIGLHVGGRRLGLDGLSTGGADVLVGVWPDQQQAGQDTQQRSEEQKHCWHQKMQHYPAVTAEPSEIF